MILHQAQTDWLGSSPVFYNEKTNLISDNILEVIDYNHFEFDPEGLNDYLQFGYSVLGQTMIKNVKFLEPNSQIKSDGKEIIITTEPDPVEHVLGKDKSKGLEVIEQIVEVTQRWADQQENIILPLSGGYDSRLLSYALRNCDKVRAYTYGVSQLQKDSFEVYNACQIAKINEISWNQVYLGDYHMLCDEWYEIYGPSVHMHGMYQMEFYDKIKNTIAEGSVLSGIVGDLWAGSVELPPISSGKELNRLGLTRGIQITDQVCQLVDPGELKEGFYQKNREKLKDERWRMIFLIRMKLMLLSYLIKIPATRGFQAWSPFLDFDICMSMMNLPHNEREGRKWQRDFFERNGLDIVSPPKQRIDFSNVLDMTALRNIPLEPLDVKLLSGVIDKNYVEFVNREIAHKPSRYLPWYKGTVYSLVNIPIHMLNKKIRSAYTSYQLLKPIEKLLKTVNNG